MTDQVKQILENSNLIDPFNRHITYLRLSVTDLCDLRCTYCMPEKMTFLNKKEPFIHRLVSVLVKKMGVSFPEIKSQKKLIENVIKEEES